MMGKTIAPAYLVERGIPVTIMRTALQETLTNVSIVALIIDVLLVTWEIQERRENYVTMMIFPAQDVPPPVITVATTAAVM